LNTDESTRVFIGEEEVRAASIRVANSHWRATSDEKRLQKYDKILTYANFLDKKMHIMAQ